MEIQHPVDDPKLPSFRHRILRELREDLNRAQDAYACLRGVKQRYLPPEPAEPPEAYDARIGRAVFSDFFRFAIESLAGVLSKFTVTDAPATFTAAIQNIDLEGNDLVTWLTSVDSTTLRDGGTWLQVEMPPDTPGNRAEELITGRRPYLVQRPRVMGVNWHTSTGDGVRELDWVMFLEVAEEPVPDGFGTELVARYRQIGRGWQSLYKVEKQKNGKWTFTIERDREPILGAGNVPINVCPVVWYPADFAAPGEGEQPLRQVMEHNIEHFQRRSDLREKDHKINMPVPVVTGATPPAAGDPMAPGGSGHRPPFVIGPNTIVNLEVGGTFEFKEPSAQSLTFSQAQITEVEKLIGRQTLGFLFGDSGAVKTATQAGMEGAQTESAIIRMSRRKASAVQSLMQIWVLFTGEQLKPTAGIAMDDSVFEPPLDSQGIAQLQSLTGGLELMSQRSGIETLQRRRYNLVTRTADEELERLAAEVPPPEEEPPLNELPPLPDDLEN